MRLFFTGNASVLRNIFTLLSALANVLRSFLILNETHQCRS